MAVEVLRYKGSNGIRAIRCWLLPYLKARVYDHQFRPLLCYLYTDWRCNIDCHYCFQFDNTRPGMTLETAKTSIEWLHSLGCRVLALMGGEVLIRKDFIIEVIDFAASKGFFVYLPTNGYLLDNQFIDEAGKAGVAAINLAVDCVAPKKGLPKALLNVEPQFRYLVERRREYNYILFFNINICRTNIKDVKTLTEIAHQNQIGTDYHLVEPPVASTNVDFYKHQDEEDLYITPNEYDELNGLLDWIIEKQRMGWPMVNSIAHLEAFKDRMRGRMRTWDCRAGLNGAFIRADGTLSPCFDLMSHEHDWGRICEPKFDPEELSAMKEECVPECSSTCYHTMGHYYNPRWIAEWIRKHIRPG